MLLYGLMLLCLPKHVRTVCMHAGQGALAHISVLNTWKYLVEAEAPGISDGLVPPRPTVPLRSLMLCLAGDWFCACSNHNFSVRSLLPLAGRLLPLAAS